MDFYSCKNAPVFHVTGQLGPLFVLKEMRFLVLQSNASNSDVRLRDNLPSIQTPPGFRCKGPGQTWKVGTGRFDESIWMVEGWPERFCVLPGLVTSHGTTFQDEMVPEGRIT